MTQNSVHIICNIQGDLFQDYPKLYRSIIFMIPLKILKDFLGEKFGKNKDG